MISFDDKESGLKLLRKWKIKEAGIQVSLTVALFNDFTLTAFGKVEEVADTSARIVGKGFDLVLGFGNAQFKDVFDEETLLEINPELVGTYPERLELIFRKNEHCVLSRPSKLPD